MIGAAGLEPALDGASGPVAFRGEHRRLGVERKPWVTRISAIAGREASRRSVDADVAITAGTSTDTVMAWRPSGCMRFESLPVTRVVASLARGRFR